MIDILFINSTVSMFTKATLSNCEANGLTCFSINSEAVDFLEKNIIQYNPKILVISWNFNETIYKFLCNSLKDIKRTLSNIKVVICSYGATYDWKNLSEINEIDYIVGGESDDKIPELCKKVLSGKIVDKLEYKNADIADLSKYDYNNNYIIINRILIFTTSRNCIYSNNRCWYCPCYNLPYRRLNLDKIIEVLHKQVDFSKIDRITLTDTEVLPEVINRIYKEFHKPIHCFILFKDLLKLSPDLKNSNSNFIFGLNIKRDGLHTNVYYSSEVIDNILDRIKDTIPGNCFSTTILVTSKEDEKNHKDLLDVLQKYNYLININFCYYRNTPRNINGNDIKENIYLEYKRNPYVWFDCVTNLEDAI